MREELRRALNGAILSSGARADRFSGGTTNYFPDLSAGRRALARAGRSDLFPALDKKARNITVLNLEQAKEILF